jgi:hypothetical protein
VGSEYLQKLTADDADNTDFKKSFSYLRYPRHLRLDTLAMNNRPAASADTET